MKYLIILTLCFVACGDGSGLGNEISTVTNTDNSSNNDNSNNNDNSVGGSDSPTDDCDSEKYLKANCDVESFMNCTDKCDLQDGEDTPEKKACDEACIDERLELASEFCYENGCE